MRWIRRVILVLFVSVVPYVAKAQFVSERSAISNIVKGKWSKAESQLTKILKKDSIHAGAEYAWSRYFFATSNPEFQIDSAYRHIQQALADYQQASTREREKLLKIPVDSNVLVDYQQRIDSAAFSRARKVNTEAAYVDFLNRFEMASQKADAIALRDAVAFAEAARGNTYQLFLTFMEKYPDSKLASEASVRYNKLLYESKTSDQTLTSYEAFLLQYPETPHRAAVEQQIFEKLTAGGEAASFERFIRKYPGSSKAKMAKNILFHLLKEDERALVPLLASDSIRKVQILEKQYLVPFLKNDRFGFINELGEELIHASASEIPDEYLCGNITDELLIADGNIITRTGALLKKAKATEIASLGYGFLLLKQDACVSVMHVSGFSPSGEECLQDARVLAKNFLLIKKNSRWGIITLTGRQLIPCEWEEIQLLGETVAFERSGKTRLVKIKDLAKVADQQPPAFSKAYDEIRLWNDGLLWVKNGSEEGLLTQTLNEWIKPARQQITQAFFGAISHTVAGYVLHDKRTGPSQHYYQVKIQQPWVLAQYEGEWHSIDLVTKKNVSVPFDSVGFVGPFFVGVTNDSIEIHLVKDAVIKFPRLARVHFVPGKDSLFFLMVEESDKRTVYNTKAEKLFTIQADKVEYNNENYFTITYKQKKGLLSMNGKVMLKASFDALGPVTNNVVATLNEKNFGLVDLGRKKEIKPEYDKNLIVYDKSRLIAFKDGRCALIGWDNKPITPFEFEEIYYWNDSSALVKKNFQWMIYNFIEKKVVLDKIKGYKRVFDSPQEKIMIVQQENKYGVISNTRGMIIQPAFSDIVNVGSPTKPMYFTEKHVEEASIFIVIYYDQNGVQLKQYVYEGSDYEKIYCSGK